jgi:hypothetical protein
MAMEFSKKGRIQQPEKRNQQIQAKDFTKNNLREITDNFFIYRTAGINAPSANGPSIIIQAAFPCDY